MIHAERVAFVIHVIYDWQIYPMLTCRKNRRWSYCTYL